MNPLTDRLTSLRAELEACLRERRLSSAQAEANLVRMVNLAGSVPEALSRSSYSPGHFTASGFVLNSARDSLLLIRHKKLGLWLQPGGHIEEGDADFLAAVRREVREETGLCNLRLMERLYDVDIHEIPERHDAARHLHFDLRALFLSEDTFSEDNLVNGGDDALEARWFSFQVLAESTRKELSDGLGTDDSVRRVALELSKAAPFS